MEHTTPILSDDGELRRFLALTSGADCDELKHR